MEQSGKILDAAGFGKVSAANEFAFFCFGEEHVLRKFFGLGFDGASDDCRTLRKRAKLQARSAFWMVKQVSHSMEQRFQKFGIIYRSRRELYDRTVASPIKSTSEWTL